MVCTPSEAERRTTPGIWNPLPYFDTVKRRPRARQHRRRSAAASRLAEARHAAGGFVGRSRATAVSEHPPSLVSTARAYVTSAGQRGDARPGLEARPRSSSPGTTGAASTTTSCRRRSTSTATAYACRARDQPVCPRGYVDHQTLSFDAYAKFIEDDFLRRRGSTRPTTGGPTRGPTCASTVSQLGNLVSDFDFARSRASPFYSRSTPTVSHSLGRVAAPVSKDQELELTIDSLAYGGNGVARLNGFVVFVRRGLPGRHRARARDEGEARATPRRSRSRCSSRAPPRVEAPCEHYPACGGCRFQDLAYEAQVAAKAGQVRDALRRIGGIAEPPLEPILPAESQSSTTATSSSTRSRRRRTGRRSASTSAGPLGRGARDRAAAG